MSNPNCNCVNLGPKNPINPVGWQVIEVGSDGAGGYTGNYPGGGATVDPTTQTVTLGGGPSSWSPPEYEYTGYIQLRLNCSNGSYHVIDSWTTQNGGPSRNLISQTMNPCGASSPPPTLPTNGDPAACFAAAAANPDYRIGLSCPQPPVVEEPPPPCLAGLGLTGTVVAGSIAQQILDKLKEQGYPSKWPFYGRPSDSTPGKAGEILDNLYKQMEGKNVSSEKFQEMLGKYLQKHPDLGYAPPADAPCKHQPPSRPPTTKPPASKPSGGGGGPKTGGQRPPSPPGPAPRPGTGRPPINLPTPPRTPTKPPFRWPQLPRWSPPKVPSMPPIPGGLKPGIIGAIPGMILDPLLNPTELGHDDEIRPGHWRPPFQPPRDPFDDFPVWDDGPTWEPPDYEPPWMGEDPNTGMPVFFDNYGDYQGWVDGAYPSPPNNNWAWPGNLIPTVEIGPITYYGPQAIPGNSVIRNQISSDQRGNRLRLGDTLYTLTSTSLDVPVWAMYQADYYPRTTTNNIDRTWSGPIQILSQGSGPRDLLAKASEGSAIITLPFVPNSPTLTIDKSVIDNTNNVSLVNRQLLEAYAGNPPLSELTVLVAKEI